MNDDIASLIDQLVNLGEDRDELQLWADMYPNLSDDERDQLRKNLETELEELITAK
jgi:hypothetical protein